MENLLSLIGAPVNAITLIIAIGILIIMLADKGLLGVTLGKKDPITKRMDSLIEYVNHRETTKLDKLIEVSTETNQLIKEIAKYGITCRKE